MHRLQVTAGATPVTRVLALAGLVAGLDQATKAWAVEALSDESISVVGDFVRLDLARNTGGAFSLFVGWAPILALIGMVLVVVLVRMGRTEQDRWLLAGLVLVLGGALGNLSDRIFRAPGFLEGAVVDFVDVGSWPTFNVADSAIVVGAVILILRSRHTGQAGDAGEEQDA